MLIFWQKWQKPPKNLLKFADLKCFGNQFKNVRLHISRPCCIHINEICGFWLKHCGEKRYRKFHLKILRAPSELLTHMFNMFQQIETFGCVDFQDLIFVPMNSTTGIAIPGGHRDLSQGLNSLHCVGGHANSQGIAACCVDAVKRIQMKN